MPISTFRDSISSTRQKIVNGNGMGIKVWVKNERTGQEESSAVYLGDETVTATTGYHLGTEDVWQGYCGPADDLYAISGGGTATITVLEVRQD